MSVSRVDRLSVREYSQMKSGFSSPQLLVRLDRLTPRLPLLPSSRFVDPAFSYTTILLPCLRLPSVPERNDGLRKKQDCEKRKRKGVGIQSDLHTWHSQKKYRFLSILFPPEIREPFLLEHLSPLCPIYGVLNPNVMFRETCRFRSSLRHWVLRI